MTNQGPLSGIRITEMTTAWAGPFASCLLGFLGAEVIKIESMARLDHARMVSFTTGRKFESPDESGVFNNLNLNKKSVCLNLKKPKAVEIVKKMAMISDVVMENLRPGVIPRLGLGYEDIKAVKPDIVYLSSSACGQTGPDREYVGYAPTFAALAGLPHITGYPDWPPSNFMGSIDLRSASTAAFVILAALYHREQTGEGQYIDMSSMEAIAAFSGDILLDYVLNQRVQERKGNRDDSMAPHNCYVCKGEDKWISIAVSSGEEWAGLCNAMGKPELIHDDRFNDLGARKQNEEALDEIINHWTRTQEDGEVMIKLQNAGVAATPSFTSETLFSDPHVKARGVFKKVAHPVAGGNWVIEPPWRLSEAPSSPMNPAPLLGQHNFEVFHEYLGISEDEIEKLKKEGVIY